MHAPSNPLPQPENAFQSLTGPKADKKTVEEVALPDTKESPKDDIVVTSVKEKVLNAEAEAKSGTQGSALRLGEVEEKFLSRMKVLLAPFGAPYVQACDEAKMPPLEVLKKVVDEGVFVTAVPLPPLKEIAKPLAAAAAAGLIGVEKAAAATRVLAAADALEPQRAELRGLDAVGRTRAMTLSSIEMAASTGPGIGTFLGVSSGLSAYSIARLAEPGQQALWLNALHHGVFTYAFGLTEPGAGSDPRSMKTTFREEVDAAGKTTYVLNGAKKFIGNAACVKDPSGKIVHPGADFIIVFAVDDHCKAPAERSFRAFMVPRSAIGEENIRHSGAEHNKLGLREVNNGDFDLKEVRVPAESMLGRKQDCTYAKMLGLLDITRLYVGAMGNGQARAALEIARGYAATRQQNGHAIVDFQLVSFPLRDLEAKTLVGKLLLLDAAEKVDRSGREKEAVIRGLDGGRESFEKALAALEVFKSKLDSTNTEKLATAKQKALSALSVMRETMKLKDGAKVFKAACDDIAAVSLLLRNGTDGAARDAVKAQFKSLRALLSTICELREPVRFGGETAMAKLYNTELSEAAVRQAIDTLGGVGFLEDPSQGHGLAKRLRDSKVLTIYEGTSNIQRNIIAQGVILRELKEIKNDFRDALGHWLLSTRATKRFCYRVLKSTSYSTRAKANAAYKFAVADVMSRYNDALAVVVADWKKNGVPSRYTGWDAKSLERQQNLLASLAVQARMGILADIAVECKLLELSAIELKALQRNKEPLPQDVTQKELLSHYQAIGLERIIQLGRQLGSDSLRFREDEYLRRWKANPGSAV